MSDIIKNALENARKYYSDGRGMRGVDPMLMENRMAEIDEALADLSKEHRDPELFFATIDLEAVARAWWKGEEGRKVSPGVIDMIVSEEGRIKVLAAFAGFLTKLIPDIGKSDALAVHSTEERSKEKDQQRAELRESALDHMGWSEESDMGELYTPTRESMVNHLVDFAMSEMPSVRGAYKKSPSDLLRDKKAGWNGLANIYEIVRGNKCDERTALGMATSAVSELKRKMDEVSEALRWRDPEKELPLDQLTRCEVLSHDQAFIAWLEEDDGPTYWILDAPMESEVGDVIIPNARAWRPASIDSKVLNPPLSK